MYLCHFALSEALALKSSDLKLIKHFLMTQVAPFSSSPKC